MVFEAMQVLTPAEINPLLDDCDKLSRMITNYSRTRLPPTAHRQSVLWLTGTPFSISLPP